VRFTCVSGWNLIVCAKILCWKVSAICRMLLYRKFGVEVRDFGSSWRDGVAFNALIHGLQPELVDMSAVAQNSSHANLERAFTTAEEHLGIPRLLDVEGRKCDSSLFLT